MAWEAYRGSGPSGIQGSHRSAPPRPQFPNETFMAQSQRQSFYPNAGPSINQYNWQGNTNTAPVYGPNIVRGPVPFANDPNLYRQNMIPSMPVTNMLPNFYGQGNVPQTASFATGMAMESSPAIPFGPESTPPIVDGVKRMGPSNHGVIRVKNIPYGITMAEVQQFVLKHVTPPDLVQAHRDGFPFHIIMERSTGKTMDAFIEVQSSRIAQEAVDRNFSGMKFSKLGQRHVNLELSSQAQLLQELFPRARSVEWDERNGGHPYLVENNDPYTSGFNGLFTQEEMNGMIRHAEAPGRSPFATRSQQRPYESMISTLYKFPWYADTLYNMKDRDCVYSCLKRQLVVLVVRADPMRQERREVGLDNKLLMDLIFAGMNCPAFSLRQKHDIVMTSEGPGCGVYLSQFAKCWPFQCLTPDSTKLTDQDIGMWLTVIQYGIQAMIRDCQGAANVGIEPYLGIEVVEDFVVVRATELGEELTRAEFAALEETFLKDALDKGWDVYLDQSGLGVDGPGPALAFNNHDLPGSDNSGQRFEGSRISTARHNSDTPDTKGKVAFQAPSAPQTPSRASRAIPILRPDGTPVKLDPFQLAEAARASRDANDVFRTLDDEASIRGAANGHGHDRTPSVASSNYNNPVISTIASSPAKLSPPRMNPAHWAARSTQASPTRVGLRRMSGASISPTKGNASVVSYHVSSKTLGMPSSSRDASFGSVLEKTGVKNPFNFAGAPRKTVVQTPGSSPSKGAANSSRSSSLAICDSEIPSAPPIVDVLGGNVERSGTSMFDPRPIGSGLRSASASTTGTVIRRKDKYAPEENPIVEEDNESLIREFRRGLNFHRDTIRIEDEATYSDE